MPNPVSIEVYNVFNNERDNGAPLDFILAIPNIYNPDYDFTIPKVTVKMQREYTDSPNVDVIY